jgi:hypothetical protein
MIISSHEFSENLLTALPDIKDLLVNHPLKVVGINHMLDIKNLLIEGERRLVFSIFKNLNRIPNTTKKITVDFIHKGIRITGLNLNSLQLRLKPPQSAKGSNQIILTNV